MRSRSILYLTTAGHPGCPPSWREGTTKRESFHGARAHPHQSSRQDYASADRNDHRPIHANFRSIARAKPHYIKPVERSTRLTGVDTVYRLQITPLWPLYRVWSALGGTRRVAVGIARACQRAGGQGEGAQRRPRNQARTAGSDHLEATVAPRQKQQQAPGATRGTRARTGRLRVPHG
jgi:hypothetical protein